jgi:tRNA(fMet)-specific endonuclease VapC
MENKNFVLDTNICIFYLRGNTAVAHKMQEAGFDNLFISEITVLELLVGVEKGGRPEKKQPVIELVEAINVIPIASTYEFFAQEKIKLQKQGESIDDFDLLIGCAALYKNVTLITNNTKHFAKIEGLDLDDWYRKNE